LTNSTSKDNILHPPLNRRLHLKAFLFNPWTTHTQSVPSLISTQFQVWCAWSRGCFLPIDWSISFTLLKHEKWQIFAANHIQHTKHFFRTLNPNFHSQHVHTL
jgi:hypothetical protein